MYRPAVWLVGQWYIGVCDMSSDGGDDDHDDDDDAQHIASCVSCHSEYIDVCTHPDAPLDTPPGQWLCGGAGTGLLHPSG